MTTLQLLINALLLLGANTVVALIVHRFLSDGSRTFLPRLLRAAMLLPPIGIAVGAALLLYAVGLILILSIKDLLR